MEQQITATVYPDGSTTIESTFDKLPGTPQMLFAIHKSKDGQFRGALIGDNENDWTAADLLKAVGGLYGSLSEDIKFGPGV